MQWCSELLYGRRFCLRLKGAVYKSYVRPAALYGTEGMLNLRRMEGSKVRAICGVQLNDRERSTDFMMMLGLNESIDQLVMANSVHWYGHVLRREDGLIIRRALDFEVEGQRKKGRLKRTWEKQVGEESEKGKCSLPIKVECWC